MPQSSVRIEVRIRDRVGVVSEVTREITALSLPISEHNARVVRDRHGTDISVFRARIPADEGELYTLRQRCSRIRGFMSFDALRANGQR